jgi:hypothetical protein
VFADADFSNIKGTIQDQGPFFAGKLKATWSWAVGPRVGLLMTPQTLTYVNGGFTQTHFNSASMVRAFNGASSTFVTPSFDRSGWFVGGGVERAFSLFGLGPGWFWRSEYRYASYGRTTLSDSVPGAGPVVFPQREHLRTRRTPSRSNRPYRLSGPRSFTSSIGRADPSPLDVAAKGPGHPPGPFVQKCGNEIVRNWGITMLGSDRKMFERGSEQPIQFFSNLSGVEPFVAFRTS